MAEGLHRRHYPADVTYSTSTGIEVWPEGGDELNQVVPGSTGHLLMLTPKG